MSALESAGDIERSRLDEKMIAELRDFRASIDAERRGMVALTLEELDAILRIVDGPTEPAPEPLPDAVTRRMPIVEIDAEPECDHMAWEIVGTMARCADCRKILDRVSTGHACRYCGGAIVPLDPAAKHWRHVRVDMTTGLHPAEPIA